LASVRVPFVGAGVTPPSRDGWQAADLPAIDPVDPMPEDTEFLRGLMTVGRGQLEFLSG